MCFSCLCKHSSVDFHFSQCPCQSICNKNKETTSQPLPEKYSFSFSHILWENIPSHYGNLFPSSREYFPKQSGMFSHNMREYFPTIYGKVGTCIIWLISAPSSLKRTGLNQIKCGCPHWFSLCYFEIRIPIGVFLRLSYTENECKSLSLSPTFQEINGTGRF